MRPAGREPSGAGRGAAARAPKRGVLLAGALVTAMGVLAAGCANQAGHPAAAPGRHHDASTSVTPASSSPPRAAAAATPRPDASPSVLAVPPAPASLHQTRTFPSTHTRAFAAEMTDLWAAVVTGRARLAIWSFFPLTAYQQVKAISDPTADWHDRLWADFGLDVRAAHHFVGRGTSLVRVIVPSAEAAWINPGVCFNSVGYWHVGGARIVYRKHGQLRSIGIASLISWRGRWYVVHFGAVLRGGAYGIVDTPAAGTGVPGPGGGC